MISLFRGKPAAFVRHLNDLVKAVNALSHLVGDGLVKVQKTQMGTTIGLDVEQLISRIPRTKGGSAIGTVRRGITTEAAPSSDHITINLYNSNGSEQTSGSEAGIEMYGIVVPGGGNLDVAVPRLADNDDVFVVKLPYSSSVDRWYCVTLFQLVKICDCYSI